MSHLELGGLAMWVGPWILPNENMGIKTAGAGYCECIVGKRYIRGQLKIDKENALGVKTNGQADGGAETEFVWRS